MPPPPLDPALLALEQRAIVRTGPLTPLLPLTTPLSPLRPNELPSRTSKYATLGWSNRHWSCETFVLPAAFPRSRGAALPVGASTSVAGVEGGAGGKVNGPAALKKLLENQIKVHGPAGETDAVQEEQQRLRLAVNRYAPRGDGREKKEGRERGVTLVFAHANGFHKETWEPTIEEVLNVLSQEGGESLAVEEIWSLDAINQGDSGVLNEGALGESFDWADNGRDILNFLVSHLDTPSSSAVDSSILPVVPLSDISLLSLDATSSPTSPGSSTPSTRSHRDRLIIGIGHSLGGGGMAYAATALPSLLSSLIFCDPVLPAPELDRSVVGLTMGALVRREKWASREEAWEGFLSKAFFRSWDERVLGLYVACGVKDVEQKKEAGKKEVALKTRAKDEALVFGDPMAVAARRACTRLTSLPSTLPVHFVLADKGRSVLTEELISSMLGRVPHATVARVQGAGHLVAQEAPEKTGRAIAEFIIKTYPKTQFARL